MASPVTCPRHALQPGNAAQIHLGWGHLRHSIVRPSRSVTFDREFNGVSRQRLSKTCNLAEWGDPESVPNVLHTTAPFWKSIKRWSHVEEMNFLRYRWQVCSAVHHPLYASETDKTQSANTIESTIDKRSKLLSFLDENVTELIPSRTSSLKEPTPKSDYLADVETGLKDASMSVRLTPYLLSIIDWSNPINDPVALQFIPLASRMLDDNSLAQLDSLHETDDSPVKGLVHRYPDKVLFLGTCKTPSGGVMVADSKSSNLRLPNLLSLLHALLRCWCKYAVSHKSIDKKRIQTTRSHVPVH